MSTASLVVGVAAADASRQHVLIAGIAGLIVGALVSLLCLIALGAIAARVGGAPVLVGAARVTIWGVLAMLVTALVGRLFGSAVP